MAGETDKPIERIARIAEGGLAVGIAIVFLFGIPLALLAVAVIALIGIFVILINPPVTLEGLIVAILAAAVAIHASGTCISYLRIRLPRQRDRLRRRHTPALPD